VKTFIASCRDYFGLWWCLRKLRPGVASVAVSSKLSYRLASLDSILRFPVLGRRRPCRNSQSQPIPAHRASTSLRESRNNFLRPPRFGQSSEALSRRRLLLEARSRGPLIRSQPHSHKGSRSRNYNHSSVHTCHGTSHSASHGASHSVYSDAGSSGPARSVLVV
jgi:hypothetical protein